MILVPLLLLDAFLGLVGARYRGESGQAAHHKKEDFRSEFLRFLRAHGVEFDERYVLDSASAGG